MEEGKKIVAKLGELKYELQHDRKMTCVYNFHELNEQRSADELEPTGE